MTHIKNQKGWCLRSDARALQTRQSGSVSPVFYHNRMRLEYFYQIAVKSGGSTVTGALEAEAEDHGTFESKMG